MPPRRRKFTGPCFASYEQFFDAMYVMPPLWLKYTYCVVWSEEMHEFIGYCVEFKSLKWMGKSQREAMDGIIRVVHATLVDMLNTKELPPVPMEPVRRKR